MKNDDFTRARKTGVDGVNGSVVFLDLDCRMQGEHRWSK